MSHCLGRGALAFALLALAPPTLAAADTPQEAVNAYLRAEHDFDQPALERVLADDFVEISPRGQVDERAAVIGFYAPEHKRPAPPLQIGTPRVQRYGETALVVLPIGFELGGQSRRMTATVTLVRVEGGWKLVAAAYTPQPAD